MNEMYERGLDLLQALVASQKNDDDGLQPMFATNTSLLRALLRKDQEAWTLEDHTTMAMAMVTLQKVGLSLNIPVDIYELVGLIPKGLSGAVHDEQQRREQSTPNCLVSMSNERETWKKRNLKKKQSL